MPKPSNKLTTDQLGRLIYEIRGERVMLDSDLASIYGVETSVSDSQLSTINYSLFSFPLLT